MGTKKSILLSILFLLTYFFSFFQPDNIKLIGPAIASISAIIFIILIIIPWEGNAISIIKRIKYNHIMSKVRDEKNYMPKQGTKIAVMLSGGVDSAVAAKLLIDDGYEVEAFFMRNWDSTTNLELNNILTEDEICQQELDYNDAKLVAKNLKIKLHRVDFVKEYWDDVFSVFLKEIENGLTPNPDILCNRHIKFDRMIDYIERNFPEFEYVATGHYAKIVEREGVKLLAQSKDTFKDQTYFLSEVHKERLNKILFPLAELNKTEIRELAIKSGLPVADKKDSVGICFIGKRNFPEFISNYLKEKKGKIIDEETGEVVGEHKGALFYTIGQRKGLDLSGYEKPYFVSNKDIKKNIIFVSLGSDNKKLLTKIIEAKNFNFLIDESLIKDDLKIIFKTKHSETSYSGKIKLISENSIRVNSDNDIKKVSAGQELVIYYNGICIGGGQII